MRHTRPCPLLAAACAVLLWFPIAATAQPTPAQGTWKASTAANGLRELTWAATVDLLGKPTRVNVKFFCDLTRGTDINGTLGFDFNLATVARLAPFHFDDFNGPDATTGDRTLMRVTIARASHPPLSMNLSPNGWSPEGPDFTFGVAEVSHVPASNEKTILQTLADDAVSFRITITDPRNASLTLDVTIPVVGRQADFRTLLAGLK